jgi:hypothetical protein
MGLDLVYFYFCPVKFQVSELGCVGEEKKEGGDSDSFLSTLWRVVLGKERQSRGFATDENGKRPGESKKMGSLEECFRVKCSWTPTAASVDGDITIQQAPGRWQPGFADEGASSQHLSFFSPERAQAGLFQDGLSQDGVNDLKWENGSIPRRGSLRLTK